MGDLLDQPQKKVKRDWIISILWSIFKLIVLNIYFVKWSSEKNRKCQYKRKRNIVAFITG